MKIHSSLTEEVLMEAAERRDSSLDNPGFCVYCGAEHYECEPDARKYPCEECGKNGVYAPEELLFMSIV